MVVATWAAGSAAVPAVAAEVVAGFETGADLQRWSAQGEIGIQRTEGPPAPDRAGDDPPAGGAARIRTQGKSGMFIKAGELPRDLTKFDALRVWVHRDPTAAAAAPSTVEVRFYESDGGAWFWRKVVLDQPGWTQVEVPFKWTRWSTSRIPRWEKVNRLGIYFRDAADVFVDSFTLADDPPPNGPEEQPVLNPHDVATLAFGAAAADPDKVRIGRAAEVAVITDVGDFDIDRLLQHLGNVAAAVKADLSSAAPTSPIAVVVFAAEDQYKEFPVKLGERLGAQSAPPTSSGYTIQGIATSSWDPRHGTLRPVYTHEFVHALLSATLDLENNGEWVQEGLASHYQLRFHPQANFRSIVSDGLKGTDPDVFKQVCSGGRIPLNHYWVAGTLCRMLLEDPDLAAKQPAVVAAIRKNGSTAMGPLLPVLGLSWQELDEKWRAYCREKYGP
jgi:hypothetical protein